MRINEHEWICRVRKTEKGFEIECQKGEERREVYCVLATRGRTIGGSGFGFGAQYGEQDTEIKCFSEDEIKEEVAKKLGVDKDKIKWEWDTNFT